MAPRARVKGQLSFSASVNLLAYRAAFGLAASIRPPIARPILLSEKSRVLCVSTAGLGDSLLDSAGIRAVAEAFPGIHLEAVVHHRRMDIAAHNPFLMALHPLSKGPLPFIFLWSRLKLRGPWDAVLYFSCHDPEVRCLGYLLSPDATVGLAWRTAMPWLCARNVDEPGLKKAHLAAQAVRVAVAAGAKESKPRMAYRVHPAERDALAAKLEKFNSPRGPAIVFQLGGGGGEYRDWPVEHFVELARLTHARGMGPIVLLGGPDHCGKAREFSRCAGHLPHCDLVGKLPLPLSAALLESARCVVSTDTGIMHLSFALGTPTLALLHWSPGPGRVGPPCDPERHVVIALPKPRGDRSLHKGSMRDILPGQAFAGLCELCSRAK